MKYLSPTMMFTCLAVIGAHAAKTGMGVSVQEDAGTIYLPIEISKHFRCEPSLFVRHTDNNYEDGGDGTSTTIQFDLGLFGKNEIYERINIYYGARLGYFYYQQERTTSFFSTYDADNHGVNIAPSRGIEYFFSERFSVVGEVSWYFKYSEGSSSSTGPIYAEESITTGTDSRLIARFYF